MHLSLETYQYLERRIQFALDKLNEVTEKSFLLKDVSAEVRVVSPLGEDTFSPHTGVSILIRKDKLPDLNLRCLGYNFHVKTNDNFIEFVTTLHVEEECAD